MPALKRLGIDPSQVAAPDRPSGAQAQTGGAFGFKWSRRDTYESAAVQEAARGWLVERYCAGDPGRIAAWLAEGPQVILDAGCGSGFSALLFFGEHLRRHDYLGVDISSAVLIAAERFAERGLPGEFLRADFTQLAVPEGSVDFVFAEGVLHHTDNTGRALLSLARTLRPGGRFLFYVYAKKAVIREFTDDYVRRQIATLDDAAAWEALLPLTRLGKALGELGVEVEVPEDVPLLGIPKGRIDVQRLFYWYVCKAYFRPDWSLEEMNHVNFDWFRPLNCHRHTPEEVRGWCAEAGLEIERMDVQEAGISVVARKAG